MEGRFIGLDVGARRIGVALSTGQGRMVLPLETVQARDRGEAARRIATHIQENNVIGIVVGWPVDMHGREGRAVERVRRFLTILKAELKRQDLERPIHRWDERLSSVAADRLLDERDLSWQRRRETIDQVAACEILQGFIDRLRFDDDQGREG